MKVFMTLSRYMAKCYIRNLLMIGGLLLSVIYLFDTIELLRRASKRGEVPLSMVLEMGLLKLPEVGQLVFPFAILFAAMLTFWQLNRRHELVIVRAAGFSVWQFLAPVIGVALLIGALQVTIINPVGALLLTKFEVLEHTHLSSRKSYVTLVKEGLWLRQGGREEAENEEYVILHAEKIDLVSWQLRKVMVLFFDGGDHFLRRIDAQTAQLEEGQWLFKDTVLNKPQVSSEVVPLVVLPTDLTVEDIEESFSAPETISFWALPGFIRTLEATGFDAVPVKIHFYNLLAQPLFFVAMILLAASVSLRAPRANGTLLTVAGGVFIGFASFFLSSFLQALGASHQIPVLLAAFSPALIMLLLGVAILMTLEDG